MTEKLLHSCDELRKLILENKDLPILIFAGEDACDGFYPWTACYSVRFSMGEFLSCDQNINEERVYTNRSDFIDDLDDYLYCNNKEYANTVSDEEWDHFLNKEIQKYDDYWKKCIIIYVNN